MLSFFMAKIHFSLNIEHTVKKFSHSIVYDHNNLDKIWFLFLILLNVSKIIIIIFLRPYLSVVGFYLKVISVRCT